MNNETKKNEPTNANAEAARPAKTADAAPVAAQAKQESAAWYFACEVGKTIVIGVAAGAAVYLGTLAAYKLSVAAGWIDEPTGDDGAQA